MTFLTSVLLRYQCVWQVLVLGKSWPTCAKKEKQVDVIRFWFDPRPVQHLYPQVCDPPHPSISAYRHIYLHGQVQAEAQRNLTHSHTTPSDGQGVCTSSRCSLQTDSATPPSSEYTGIVHPVMQGSPFSTDMKDTCNHKSILHIVAQWIHGNTAVFVEFGDMLFLYCFYCVPFTVY